MKQTVLTKHGIKKVDLNPRRAIRRHCQMCSDYSWEDVKTCNMVACELHTFRTGTGADEKLSPEDRIGAIQRYCLYQCKGGDEHQFQSCDMRVCPLFNFRLKSPYRNKFVCAV